MRCREQQRALSEVLSSWRGNSAGTVSGWSTHHLNLAKLLTGNAHEVIEPFSGLLRVPDQYLATIARAHLARALVLSGDLPGAEREARVALDGGSGFPTVERAALGALAMIELRRGNPARALGLADRGLDAGSLAAPRLLLWVGSQLGLARAEALHALGRIEDAHNAIREVRECVLRVAATLDDYPDLRESFLTRVLDNVRTLELASEWLGEQSPRT
jgi:hypothetical protein